MSHLTRSSSVRRNSCVQARSDGQTRASSSSGSASAQPWTTKAACQMAAEPSWPCREPMARMCSGIAALHDSRSGACSRPGLCAGPGRGRSRRSRAPCRQASSVCPARARIRCIAGRCRAGRPGPRSHRRFQPGMSRNRVHAASGTGLAGIERFSASMFRSSIAITRCRGARPWESLRRKSRRAATRPW